jgi:hypothetical protein
MTVREEAQQVLSLLNRINEAGFGCDLSLLAELLDDAVVMVYPGFGGRAEGKDAVLAGFEDFCANARVIEHSESDHQVDAVGGTAVASFRFEIVYERGGGTYRSKGRDLWVFGREGERWRARWRTMLDLSEELEA